MKIKNEKIKTAVILGGMVLVFAVIVLVPYGLRDAGLADRIDAARDELGISSVDNEGLARLNQEVKRLQAELDGRGRYVPTRAQIAQVIKEFSGLINEHGVTGQEIVTGKEEYYADYNILPVKIQFRAPFATAYDLVERIEGLSSVVRIDDLSIEAEPDYPRQPLTVNLKLSAFFTTENASRATARAQASRPGGDT